MDGRLRYIKWRRREGCFNLCDPTERQACYDFDFPEDAPHQRWSETVPLDRDPCFNRNIPAVDILDWFVKEEFPRYLIKTDRQKGLDLLAYAEEHIVEHEAARIAASLSDIIANIVRLEKERDELQKAYGRAVAECAMSGVEASS
jgi:hypothetical protein